MELLLNLLWLTLALPAIWVWRHESAEIKPAGGYGRLRAVLLLICVLTLLFPVVSATDDLHPMRPELEESNPFKRIVKASAGNSAGAWLSNPDTFSVRSISSAQICPCNEVCALVSLGSLVSPDFVTLGRRDSRAPPSLLLG